MKGRRNQFFGNNASPNFAFHTVLLRASANFFLRSSLVSCGRHRRRDLSTKPMLGSRRFPSAPEMRSYVNVSLKAANRVFSCSDQLIGVSSLAQDFLEKGASFVEEDLPVEAPAWAIDQALHKPHSKSSTLTTKLYQPIVRESAPLMCSRSVCAQSIAIQKQ